MPTHRRMSVVMASNLQAVLNEARDRGLRRAAILKQKTLREHVFIKHDDHGDYIPFLTTDRKIEDGR